MADTIVTQITTANWTQVSVGTTGWVTNSSSNNIVFRESSALPSSTVTTGHNLRARTGIGYNLSPGQQMFTRSIGANSSVIVTPGISFFGEVGNSEEIILPSAARTATVNSADFVNRNAKGIKVVVDISAVTATPSIIVKIQGKDPVSGNYYDILISASYTTVATNVLTIFPSIPDVADLKASDILPRTYRVRVEHADTDSITYSVSGALISWVRYTNA